MSIRGVSGLALEESKMHTSVEFRELFLWIAFSAHGRLRQIGMYFPRYWIGSILTACFAVVIKYLGKYLTICLILSCAKEAIYKRQNSIFIFYINMFQRKKFTKIGIDSGFACKWLVGVIKPTSWPPSFAWKSKCGNRMIFNEIV